MTDTDIIIDQLVSTPKPVHPLSTAKGKLALLIIGTATLASVALLYGFRADVMAGSPAPLLSIALGLMLILAVVAGAAATRMASPQVGAKSSGAPAALAALLILPVAATIDVFAGPGRLADVALEPGLRCLSLGLAASLAALAFLTVWLRRGAPAVPERAAWIAGLAAGAVGALAVTLECPRDAMAHLAVWHVAIILAAGALSRLLLPRFLRW